MEVGETKTSRIDADEAYGPRREDLLLDVPREQIPSEIDLQVGQQLTLQQPNGQAVPVTVAEFSDETVTLDANHPLAGEALTFELTLVEIV